MADLGRMKEELLVLMAKMDGVERVHAALSAAETAAVCFFSKRKRVTCFSPWTFLTFSSLFFA